MLLTKRNIFSFPGYKNLVSIIRQAASYSQDNPSKPQEINSNITFRPAANSQLSDGQRPIVLLYGWLVAKTQHMYKYGDFYLDKGYDVVHVKVKPDQLLWPSHAQAVVGDVLKFVSEPERCHQPILYHGFSVGAYLYGETLLKIHTIDKYKQVGSRLKGQILDSPVDYVGIPSGFSQAVTNVVILQKLMQASLEGYMKLFYNSATIHYIQSSTIFKENQLKVPALFMYSYKDVVASARIIEEVMDLYRNNGIMVEGRVFEESYHVGHFHKNKEQYTSALNDFIHKINLVPKSL